MEIILLVVAIGLLAYLISAVNSKFERMDYKLRDLNRTLELLKKQETADKPIGKPETPVTASVPKKSPAAPIPIAMPAPEVRKPQAIPPGKIPQPTAVFTMETTSKTQYARPAVAPYIPKKSAWESFKEKNPDLEKFIGENLINKIGVLILVLGISYFVKFAIDKNWINEPARAGIGILCGALVMGFAHKLRKNYAAFSSVLVAGAVSIFYFTIGIAFHDYHLFNQTVAFIIMVAITAFSCLVSLSYNRKELAVLSLIGGFAVPFMVSTGSGNYTVLFTYILILDIGILALAYNRKWAVINILSYVFTVVLYGAWLYGDRAGKQPHHVGALIFGFAFYFVFILTNIINNLRTKGVFSAVELSILASNTFLFYAAGMVILSDFHPEYKGLFTTVLALLNLVYAWFLYKKFGLDKTAVYLLIGLTLTFVTLAVPIQFEGNYITLFWAAEAVLLIWLAQKSGIVAYRFGSVAVHFLMVISLAMDWEKIYNSEKVLNIAINPAFITGVFSLISLATVHWLLKKETESHKGFMLVFNPAAYRKYIMVLAIVLAYCIGIFEVGYQAYDYISSAYSAVAFPLLYHLLFFAGLCHFLWKDGSDKFASVLAMANIVLFALWFSAYPFIEHQEYIASGAHQRIAFYLHYASLATVLYLAYRLYKTNRKQLAFQAFGHAVFTWIAAFFVVYVAGSELMLHGLVLSNTPVTIGDIQLSAFDPIYKRDNTDYIRSLIAGEKVSAVRSQVVKTGFPVLWGLLAFAFLIIGIKKQHKPIRIVALALLGITILKLFLFDISNASETGKIIAFILLGVLILIISFVYQKIKVLVLDDKPVTTDESE